MNARAATILASGLLLCAGAIGCGQGGDDPLFPAAEAEASTAVAPPRTPPDLGSELLRRVNEYRVARGLNALIDSSSLRDVARAHSESMRDGGWFSHESPDGLSAGARLTAAGVSWTVVGENLAKDISGPQAVLFAWLDSPDHRANLEAEEWTHAGVGWVSSTLRGRSDYVTLVFVRP